MPPHTSNSLSCPIATCARIYNGRRARDSLRQHLREVGLTCTTHRDQYTRLYSIRREATILKCPHCPKKFGRSYNFTRHIDIREVFVRVHFVTLIWPRWPKEIQLSPMQRTLQAAAHHHGVPPEGPLREVKKPGFVVLTEFVRISYRKLRHRS